MKENVVFLGCERVPVEDTDDKLWMQEIESQGYSVSSLNWKEPLESFPKSGTCLLRTPWDYFDHLTEFLSKLQQLEERDLQVLNPRSVVSWNVDKAYLKQMNEQGIPTIPSFYPGVSDEPVSQFLKEHPSDEYLLKPRVGAGGFGFQRLSADELIHVLSQWQETDGPVFAQPIQKTIATTGEKSLMYSRGELTHAVQKLPKSGEIRIQEEWGGSTKLYEPSPDERALADKLIHENAADLLYARVDIINDEAGRPLLMELELIEPSLYFRYLPEIVGRYTKSFCELV